jgi:transcriptional regulator with XRE-family HTH domain
MAEIDPRLVQIGQRIAVLRKAKTPKLTQEDAAHAAGLTLRHYQRLEAGTENPTATTLMGLAKALGVPVSQILDE